MLGRNQGKTVRLVGRVLGLGGNVMDLEASDKGKVQVTLSTNSSDLQLSSIVEVIGKSTGPASMDEMLCSVWNPEFNLENYDQMILLAEQFPQIFGH